MALRALRQQRSDKLATQRRVSLVVALCIMLIVWLMPNQAAQAYYNDVATDYPAMQELVPDGGVLTAADIPEGVYIVPAQTSSYMCKLYDPRSAPNDSDPTGKKALEDKCQITVAGGSITATFYISKAYTALYFGSAADAASSTNDEGTDGSAYWFGTPADGYVYRMISIPVASLNEAFQMATYTGGQSFENGKWYDRMVLLQAGDEVMNAINNSSGEEPGGDPEGGGNDDPEGGGNDDPEGGGNEDPEGGGNDDPEGGGNSDPEGGGNDDPEGGGNNDPEGGNKDNPEGGGSNKDNPNGNGKSGSGQGNSNSPSGINSRTNNGGAAASTKTNDSGDGSNGGGGSDAASSSASGNAAQAQTGATRTRTGFAMSVVKPNDPVVVEVQPLQMPEEKKTGFKITLPFIIACSLALLVAAGVGWRIWGYRRALKAPVPFAEQGTLPERKDS